MKDPKDETNKLTFQSKLIHTIPQCHNQYKKQTIAGKEYYIILLHSTLKNIVFSRNRSYTPSTLNKYYLDYNYSGPENYQISSY